MTAKEYLQKIGIKENSSKNICFVIGKTICESDNLKEVYYRSSPIRCAYEWFESLNHAAFPEKNILNYHVLNIKAPHTAWLSGVNWNGAIENGMYISLLVMSDEELDKYYSRKQWEQTVAYCEKRINEIINNGGK